jgi:hypothetical protein
MTKRTYGHTKPGKPIEDELIGMFADEAEAGYDVDEIIAGRGGTTSKRADDLSQNACGPSATAGSGSAA